MFVTERRSVETKKRRYRLKMSNYTFWYGGYKVQDLRWLVNALSDLKNNEWNERTPVYFDGSGWSDCDREQAAISLLGALKDNANAKSMILRNASLGLKAQKAVKDVLIHNSTLQSVSMKYLRTDGTAMTIPVELFRNKNLRNISLSHCVLDRAGCVALGKLVRESRVLRTLNFSNVTFPVGGLAPLSAALLSARSLRKLILHGSDIADEEFSKFLAAVGGNKSLTCLHLEQMKLASTEHGNGIAQMLKDNNCLTKLSLRRNDLAADAVEPIFVVGIASNDTLETLCLQHNHIGDDAAEHVVAALRKNTALRTLNLMHCEVREGGCVALARGLASFTGIRRLLLDGNDVEDCADEILKSLQSNVYIHTVLRSLPRLMKDHDDSDTWKKVDLYLQMNKAKRRFLVERDLAPCLLPVILGCSDVATSQPDVLFRLLRQIPSDIAGTASGAPAMRDTTTTEQRIRTEEDGDLGPCDATKLTDFADEAEILACPCA